MSTIGEIGRLSYNYYKFIYNNQSDAASTANSTDVTNTTNTASGTTDSDTSAASTILKTSLGDTMFAAALSSMLSLETGRASTLFSALSGTSSDEDSSDPWTDMLTLSTSYNMRKNGINPEEIPDILAKAQEKIDSASSGSESTSKTKTETES